MEVVGNLHWGADAEGAGGLVEKCQVCLFLRGRRGVNPVWKDVLGDAIDTLEVDAVGDG